MNDRRKTTLTLPCDLIRAGRISALEQGTTLSEIAQRGIEAELAAFEQQTARQPVPAGGRLIDHAD